MIFTIKGNKIADQSLWFGPLYLKRKNVLYKKASAYIYLKNNKKAVKWTASNSKVSLSKKTKGFVKCIVAKSAGTFYVTAKVGRKNTHAK